VSEGFSEVITYSFQDKGEVKLANPLASDKKYLRNSLETGLIKAFELNNKHRPLLGFGGAKLFEIGKVFSKNSESLSLGIITEDQKSLQKAKKETENVLGYSGEIKNDLLIITEIDEAKLPEVNSYDELTYNLTETKKFKEISPYPFVLRDIAVWTPEGTEALEVEEIIKSTATDLLVTTNLFDTYTKETQTSYAFGLVFQSEDHTLTDIEVGKIMKNVEFDLNKREGFKVR